MPPLRLSHHRTDEPPSLDGLLLRSYRLQSCLEGTDAGTWEWNIQTNAASFNERWANIAGYSLAELGPITASVWENLAHPDDLARSALELQRHWDGETDFYSNQLRMRHKQGHWVWVHARGRVFTRTPDGKPEWMFGTHLLIQEQKEREEQLERMQRLFSRMEKIAGVGGWEFDLETNELIWTEETRRIHGVPDDYVPSINDGISFYAPEARDVITQAVNRGLTDGTPWDLELPFIQKNGSRIWVRAVGEVESEQGKPRRLYGAFQDITDRVRRADELRARQEWMRLACASGGIGLWSFDAVDGTVTWDAKMATHFMMPEGYAPPSLAAWLELLPADDVAKLKNQIRRLISGQEQITTQIDLYDRNGLAHSLKLIGQAHRDKDGLLDCIQGACFDLTLESELTLNLQGQTEQLTTILTAIGDGAITTDAEGRVTWINPAAALLTGFPSDIEAALSSSELFSIYDEQTGAQVPDPVLACLKRCQTVSMTGSIALRRRSGADISIDFSATPIFNDTGSPISAVLVFRDVTEQRATVREATLRASRDPLTGLANRAEFENRLAKCLASWDRQDSYLIFIDLDHFKTVNDTLGHEAGDNLLREVSLALQEAAGPNALVARWGGDEFVALMRLPSASGALAFGEVLLESIATCGSRLNLTVGASLGITCLHHAGQDMTEHLNRADHAAYAAKAAGRGQVRLWTAHGVRHLNPPKRAILDENDVEKMTA